MQPSTSHVSDIDQLLHCVIISSAVRQHVNTVNCLLFERCPAELPPLPNLKLTLFKFSALVCSVRSACRHFFQTVLGKLRGKGTLPLADKGESFSGGKIGQQVAAM